MKASVLYSQNYREIHGVSNLINNSVATRKEIMDVGDVYTIPVWLSLWYESQA